MGVFLPIRARRRLEMTRFAPMQQVAVAEGATEHDVQFNSTFDTSVQVDVAPMVELNWIAFKAVEPLPGKSDYRTGFRVLFPAPAPASATLSWRAAVVGKLPATLENLLLNPGWESGQQLSGAVPYWKMSIGGIIGQFGSIGVVNNAGLAHSGSWYLQASLPGALANAFAQTADAADVPQATKYFEVSPGQAVIFGGYGFRSAGSGSGRFTLTTYNARKVQVSSVSTPNVSAAAWTLLQARTIIPVGVAFVTFETRLSFSGSTTTVRYDDVFLKVSKFLL